MRRERCNFASSFRREGIDDLLHTRGHGRRWSENPFSAGEGLPFFFFSSERTHTHTLALAHTRRAYTQRTQYYMYVYNTLARNITVEGVTTGRGSSREREENTTCADGPHGEGETRRGEGCGGQTREGKIIDFDDTTGEKG